MTKCSPIKSAPMFTSLDIRHPSSRADSVIELNSSFYQTAAEILLNPETTSEQVDRFVVEQANHLIMVSMAHGVEACVQERLAFAETLRYIYECRPHDRVEQPLLRFEILERIDRQVGGDEQIAIAAALQSRKAQGNFDRFSTRVADELEAMRTRQKDIISEWDEAKQYNPWLLRKYSSSDITRDVVETVLDTANLPKRFSSDDEPKLKSAVRALARLDDEALFETLLQDSSAVSADDGFFHFVRQLKAKIEQLHTWEVSLSSGALRDEAEAGQLHVDQLDSQFFTLIRVPSFNHRPLPDNFDSNPLIVLRARLKLALLNLAHGTGFRAFEMEPFETGVPVALWSPGTAVVRI